MFHARRLLPKQRIINNRNLQRINPLNECESIYSQKIYYKNENPLNECERPIQNQSILKIQTKNKK